MADILSVEVGDKFHDVLTKITLEVVNIWFEFSVADQRWETSVGWRVRSRLDEEGYELFDKAKEFVKIVRETSFLRMGKVEESSSSNGTTETSPLLDKTGKTLSLSSTDPKKKQWEDDFRQNATGWGLSPLDLGRMINLGGNHSRNYTIIGSKSRNWKMPILVKGKRGGIYKITVQKAKAGMV